MPPKREFEPAVRPSDGLRPDALAFAFCERRLLVFCEEGSRRVRLPRLDEIELEIAAVGSPLQSVRQQFLGRLGDQQAVSLELTASAEAPAGMALEGLRALFDRLEDDLFWLAARAVQIVDWDRDHQFCGRCGSANEDHPDERSKRCPNCGLTQYPRIAPAVIVLVRRGEEMLLARSPHFAPGVYSTLAGFVEPGERLEDTVRREIREEVGVELRKIRYFGSQPWPFPHSLMVGFTAEYAGGEICFDGVEIEDAGWFTAENLPVLPSRLSIARALIEDFLARSRSNDPSGVKSR